MPMRSHRRSSVAEAAEAAGLAVPLIGPGAADHVLHEDSDSLLVDETRGK